jgi:hypothetical protein
MGFLDRLPPAHPDATANYAGVDFGSLVHCKVTSRPIYDEAERATAAVEHNLEIVGYVSATPGLAADLNRRGIATTDNAMANIRKALTQPGQALRFHDKGFGPLNINTGVVLDARFGPHPRLLDWVPVGNDQTALVSWKCQVVIPECDTARYRYAVMAINWDVTYDINNKGEVEITYSGYLEIPMTRSLGGGRQFQDTADNYRGEIEPELPLGFTRTQSFRISKDKRRLDFTIKDRQMAAPLPFGVAEGNMEHRFEAPMPFVLWRATLSGDLTLLAGEHPPEGVRRFFAILAYRIGLIRSGSITGVSMADLRSPTMRAVTMSRPPPGAPPDPSGDPRRRGLVLISNISVTESLYTRRTSFSCSYQVIGVPLRYIFSESGLWDLPVDRRFVTSSENQNYENWRAQAFGDGRRRFDWAPLRVYGKAKAKNSPGDDVIIDLCDTDPPATNPNPNTGPVSFQLVNEEEIWNGTGGSWDTPNHPGQNPNNQQGGTNHRLNINVPVDTPIDPTVSWVKYEMWTEYFEDERLGRHKKLTGTVAPTPGPAANESFQNLQETGAPGPLATVSNQVADVFQQVGTPTARLVLSGYAVRAGHRIPLPRLVKVGGLVPVARRLWFRERALRQMGEIIIYRNTWRIEYLLAQPPKSTIETLANPLYNISGTNSDD